MLTFDPTPHHYHLDGVRVPSVTEVLHDSGLIRLDHLPAFILEAARRRGTDVHAALHFVNDGDLDASSVADQYQPYLEAWQRYRAERDVVVLLCEHRLASRRYRVAGTLDLLCSIGTDGWLIDYATGDPATVAKDLQTAAYLGLALEWAAHDPRLAEVLRRHPRWRRGAVQLRPNGTFRFTEYTAVTDYTHFQTLAGAWHIRQARRAVRTPEAFVAEER